MLEVSWNGAPLQTIKAPDTDKVAAYDPYSMPFAVDIPSFAMVGPYSLKAYPRGSFNGGSVDNLACLLVTFNLWVSISKTTLSLAWTNIHLKIFIP